MFTGSQTPDTRARTTNANVEDVALRAAKSFRPLGFGSELDDSCARVATRINVAIGSTIPYAGDDALFDVLEF
jgi:hypothetical protein